MTKPDGERIQSVEDKVDGLQKDLTEIKTDIKEIRSMVQNKLTDHITMFDRITTIEKEIGHIRSQSGLWKWLSPTLAAIVSSIMTFLIIEFLKSK